MVNLWGIDLNPIVSEIQALKNNQQTQQSQIIALLQEQNQLLKELKQLLQK